MLMNIRAPAKRFRSDSDHATLAPEQSVYPFCYHGLVSGPAPVTVPTGHVTPQMSALVGRAYPQSRTSFPITAGDIRRWAAAVYWPELPPRDFWDLDQASTTYGGLVAPQEFNPFAWMSQPPSPGAEPMVTRSMANSHPDQLVEGLFATPGPGLENCLNGGSEISYGDALMRPDDVITERSFHCGYHERTGRLGLMLFTRTEIRWENQRGETVKSEMKTLIRY
jgi:hypothetical protein